MPRIGRNPMKWVTDMYRPKEITVTTIVYIPSLTGYWEHSLDVLKVCINSLYQNTAQPFDLMVFDNGSCGEVQDYLFQLLDEGRIQYLTFSQHNVGKTAAWNMLFSAAPGEFIAYMDSDVLFFPAWLDKSLEILRIFPNAGLISAQPHRGEIEKTAVTLADTANNHEIEVKTGQLLPERHQLAQRMGLGYTLQAYQELMAGKNDILISAQGVSAYVGATHFQFLTTKELMTQVIPIPATALIAKDENELQVRVNNAGRWQLATTDYLIHHLGNRLPSAETMFDGLAEWYPQDFVRRIVAGQKSGMSAGVTPNRIGRRVLKTALVQKFLWKINTSTYRLLTAEHQSNKFWKEALPSSETSKPPRQGKN